MHHLIYVSAARHLMSEDDATALLLQARARNAERGVTGMLLYKDGSFMQLLEGDEAAVQDTFDRIRNDPRHGGIQVLRDGPLEQRNFDGWSMGFRSVRPADLALVPGFADLALFTDPQVMAHAHIALKMLRTFHHTTR